MSLSRVEQLLAGSTAPGAAEAGWWWLGEVRTYPEGREPGKTQRSRERNHGDPGWLQNREREKNLGDVREGQGLLQEALLSRLTSWRNKVLFSGPGLSEASFWLCPALLLVGQPSAAELRASLPSYKAT